MAHHRLIALALALIPALALAQTYPYFPPPGTTYTKAGASWNGSTPPCPSTNAQTGATYTLALTDANACVTMNNAGSTTVTIPTNASVAFAIGTRETIQDLGVFPTKISPAGGVTLNNGPSPDTIAVPFGRVTIVKTGTNTWDIISPDAGGPVFSGIYFDAPAASTDAHFAGITADPTTGSIEVDPFDDTITANGTSYLRLIKGTATGGNFKSFSYQDESDAGVELGLYTMATNDFTLISSANGAPAFKVTDPGTSASAFVNQSAGSQAMNFGCYAQSNAVGGAFTNAILGNHCELQAPGNTTEKYLAIGAGTRAHIIIDTLNNLSHFGDTLTGHTTYLDGGAPSITSGFGTTGPPTIDTGAVPSSFQLTIGTNGTDTSGVIALPTAAHAWVCRADDQTTAGTNETKQTANGVSSATLTNYNTTTGAPAAWTSGDVLAVSCFAH